MPNTKPQRSAPVPAGAEAAPSPSPRMVKLYKIRVTGHVQGVYYRASTERRAAELSLAGFVRNERDGSVYIEAEGEEEDLEQLVVWCQEGPPMAQVENVAVEEASPKRYAGFEVRQ